MSSGVSLHQVRLLYCKHTFWSLLTPFLQLKTFWSLPTLAEEGASDGTCHRSVTESRLLYYLTNLKLRVKSICPLLEKYDDINVSIKELDDTDNEMESTDFQDKYFRLLAKAEEILTTGNAQASTSSSPIITEQTQSVRDIQIRLPTINLQSFSGKYEEWVKFSETFISLIHQNPNLDAINKYHYLTSCLRGDAAQTIKSLPITSTNYLTAWDMLKTRFENKKLIALNHVKALFEIPNVGKETLIDLQHLINETTTHLEALKVLGDPINQWDRLLVYLITTKLDNTTIREWEIETAETDNTQYETLKQFLKKKCKFLETIQATKSKQSSAISSKCNKTNAASIAISKKLECPVCKQEHYINQCSTFIQMTPKARANEARRAKLCINCFRPYHRAADCRSRHCKVCGAKHNTMLHETESPAEPIENAHSQGTTSAACANVSNQYSFLSTAMVLVKGCDNNWLPCRVLLDTGAQSSFISNSFAKRLKLKTNAINVSLRGISGPEMVISKECSVQIKSRLNGYKLNTKCYILDELLKTPHFTHQYSNFKLPKNIQLADPSFNRAAKVDLIMGNQFVFPSLCVGHISRCENHPLLQKTQFGWVLSGSVDVCESKITNYENTLCVSTYDKACVKTHELVKKFWALEEVAHHPSISLNDKKCLQHFTLTHNVQPDGRFVVRLPIKENAPPLGDSRKIAESRFLMLEKKFQRQPSFKREYKAFIDEYIALGHMRKVHSLKKMEPHFYLPHHAVIKNDSLTTKLRVVFDGSAKTTSNFSLNDTLLKGPTLQDDLLSILLRFRCHKYVICADIAKMYRQIRVHDSDLKYQRVLWRDHSDNPLDTYELTTVTYGTSPAAFLAINCLQKLAKNKATEYPTGSRITLSDFYVDDLITGSNSINEAITIANETSKLLNSGGFELRKWMSNNSMILNHITETHTRRETKMLTLDADVNTKTLGILWNNRNDVIKYATSVDIERVPTTKRKILSVTASMFDPIGLLGPVLVAAKIILQRLWELQLDWDESVPLAIHYDWTEFQRNLPHLGQITIPRFVMHPACDNTRMELHGFCDASMKAYGACVYIRSHQNGDGVCSRLLCARNKGAPTKVTTIPRLELCAALLLTRLMAKVLSSIRVQTERQVYWTDSSIVLAWLRTQSKTLNVFVSNRISEIQNVTAIEQWRHVPTNSNPADILSRGTTPQQLATDSKWWNGPDWLCLKENNWPIPDPDTIISRNIPEIRATLNLIAAAEIQTSFVLRFSSFSKLTRVVAWCFRYYKRIKYKQKGTGPLQADEISRATIAVIRMTQKEAFPCEFKALKQRKSVNSRSSLLSLHPFLDDQEVLRVGGRLSKSDLHYNQRHPMILSRHQHLSKIIIRQEHCSLLHAGVQTTLSSLRNRYWILGGRNSIKNVIRQCVLCIKAKPKLMQHIMGDLPRDRVTHSRPFATCGLDLAGPIHIKEGGRRSKKTIKIYIGVFVCFATRAVHLEIISDLTTEACIAAIRRFVSRRGKIETLWTDNGTNFSGASSELKHLHQLLSNEDLNNPIAAEFASSGIKWRFIPARSPHFGGLWEAAVKSAKVHIRKVVGNALLTYEEFLTFLIQVEGILNSRPLTPITDDPEDQEILTPAHFLIGSPMNDIPTPNLAHLPDNRLSRWQYVQKLREQFWTRWSKEYLMEQQKRSKWKRDCNKTLKVGQVVLIKDDGLHSFQWLTGRVTEVHPGADGIVRTATIKLPSKRKTTRAVRNLCILPIDQ